MEPGSEPAGVETRIQPNENMEPPKQQRFNTDLLYLFGPSKPRHGGPPDGQGPLMIKLFVVILGLP